MTEFENIRVNWKKTACCHHALKIHFSSGQLSHLKTCPIYDNVILPILGHSTLYVDYGCNSAFVGDGLCQDENNKVTVSA